VARSLAVRAIVAAQLILAASGLLGVVLRWSQGVPDMRVGDNGWYAMMTAHGLGTFVGWGAFSVMGLSWWILYVVGFPTRGLGLAFARMTWWLMVLGVAGVVVSTLVLQFGASWVFLYPLPFESAGEWGAWATGLFSLSVLLAGLSIVTWCFGILHTVVNRDALHAVRTSVANRLGVALGWGFLFPRRFATNPRSVPYPVIPLAVIGLDMIVATLPLAGLLVWQIFQAAGWVGDADPLFAKNILWWFGHPVVYLLLFPAVAAYYLLIPRYAGRELVAGNVIAIAWTVAVIANVLVWAHHVYLDYPEGTPQSQINTVMQPLTFSLVLPSALSLYSLAFTIYRSRFKWTAASTALFLGLVGWLLAGLSGIVNATIAFDVVLHNTLWIVGHFHHMAMLNIGLLIFGAIYALLPELTGKALYSEGMARVHVWGTFVFGMAVFGIWLVQGLDGAPRRWSVLPGEYDNLTRISLPFVVLLAAVQALFFWNLLQTLRGKGGFAQFDERGIPLASTRARRPAPVSEALLVLATLGLAAAFALGGFLVGRATGDDDSPGGTGSQPTTTAVSGDAAAGAAVFESAACGGCHAFAAAGATGAVGPDLTATELGAAAIRAIVTSGRGGMPAFGDKLSEQEIADVAAYVTSP
jgi:cytochrome c oxidase subunit 1